MSLACLASAAFVLSACDERQHPKTSSGQADIPQILATVNGEAITQDDVLFALERTFTQLDLISADDALQQKVLDSLIASRAMKLLVLEELNAQEKARIAQQAKAYEEELYVKEYLQRRVTPEPVTHAMVQQYYDENPTEFGGENLHDFELLSAPAGLNEAQRDQLLKETAAIRASAHWSSSAAAWREKWNLQYRQGRSRPGLLDKALEQRISALDKGATSDVFYINGEWHLVRVTDVIQTPPKSLAEVSSDIRRRLAPLMLREAVKTASNEARSKVEVLLVEGQ